MTEQTPKNPDTITLTINGRSVTARKGESIIEVAGRNGMYIPHYCWHPGLSIAGSCRLCLVEIATFNPREGKNVKLPKPVIACQTTVSEGMEVWTDSPLAKDCQSGMMELLLANHPLDCPICDRGGECMLQRYSMDYGRSHSVMIDQKRKFKKPEFDSLIDIERNRCIMCTRCVRFCDEIAGDHVMGVFGRGNDNYIGTFGQGPVSSLFSGNVIDLCPVGCLTSKPYRFRARPWELAQAQSTCVNCSTGCKVTYWTRNGKLYRVTPPSRRRFDEFTLNEDSTEFICNVGRFGSDFALHSDRVTEPRVNKGGAVQSVDWSQAIDTAKTQLMDTVKNHGPDAVGFLVSPRASLEDGYIVSRLARERIGTSNIDWRTWVVNADAAKAVSRSFANADGDLETPPDVILVINGDLKNQVPITALRIKEAARKNGTKVVVFGHHHDAWLSQGSSLQVSCSPGTTASRLAKAATMISGKETSDAGDSLSKLVKTLSGAKRGLIVHSLEDLGGAHAAAEVAGVQTLRAALGDGWKSMPIVTGRNAIGLFAAGAQPDRLPGGSIHSQDAVRVAVEHWKSNLPEKAGLSGPEILEAAAKGTIKTLVVVGQDVLSTAPDQGLVRKAIESVETLIVVDLFGGNAANRADVFLPMAAPWETDGTYGDIQGNLARSTSGEKPPGASRMTCMALVELGRALGGDWGHLDSVEAVFNEMKTFLAPDSPLGFVDLELEGPGKEFPIRERSTHEVTGLARSDSPDYNPGDYQASWHLRWSEGDGAHVAADLIPNLEAESGDGLVMVWGPTLLGSDSYIDRSSGIEVMRPDEFVEIHPTDAARLSIQDGDAVTLEIDGVDGEAILKANVCSGPAAGSVYVPAGLTDIRVGRLERLPRVRLSKPELVRS